MINNISLVKDLNALGAIGGNPFDYFEDVGIKEVALYGNDDLISLVWTYGYWCNIKVKYIFGDCVQDISINVGERTRSSVLHVSTDFPPDNIPVVLLDIPKFKFNYLILKNH